jgi:hypothetical protein
MLGVLACGLEQLSSPSLCFSLSLPLAVKGVCDLLGEGDLLIAWRKVDLSSADFWKGLGFEGEACMKGAAGCDCDCDCGIIWVGEKISCEIGQFLLNLSRHCSVLTASSLSLLLSRCSLGD